MREPSSGKIVSEIQSETTETPDVEVSCPGCGLTREELYRRGQMGCARCYAAFSEEVEQALEEIHGHVEHVGKTLH